MPPANGVVCSGVLRGQRQGLVAWVTIWFVVKMALWTRWPIVAVFDLAVMSAGEESSSGPPNLVMTGMLPCPFITAQIFLLSLNHLPTEITEHPNSFLTENLPSSLLGRLESEINFSFLVKVVRLDR